MGSALHLTVQSSVTNLCRPFGAGACWVVNQGLKPLAESLSPFGTSRGHFLHDKQGAALGSIGMGNCRTPYGKLAS
jgi:hypothetical protein